MKKILSYLFPLALMFLILLVMGETNYNACQRAINQTERRHADIIGLMQVYGFDPQNNPMYEPTTNEKIRAVFIIKSNSK
jgi:hypothetical protein